MNTATSSNRVLGILFAGLLLTSLMEGVYSYRISNRLTELERSLNTTISSQGETIQKLSQHLEQSDERNGNLQKEVALTQNRLGMTRGELQKTRQTAQQLAQQQKESAEQLATQLGQLQQEQVATKGTVGNLSSDVSGVKQEVTFTKEQLASTRSDLQRVIGDLGVQSDLVAHNRTELEELKLLGQRDYHEFDLRKSSRPERVGNIALGLKKTDVKRQKYTLTLVADDRTIEKKDKTVNEPVQFYQEGYRQPTEIVVNQVYKERIVGYVSVPKKQEPRSASSASASESAKTGS